MERNQCRVSDRNNKNQQGRLSGVEILGNVLVELLCATKFTHWSSYKIIICSMHPVNNIHTYNSYGFIIWFDVI